MDEVNEITSHILLFYDFKMKSRFAIYISDDDAFSQRKGCVTAIIFNNDKNKGNERQRNAR
jgi:hypothetical protein